MASSLPGAADIRRPENLALSFQELFTGIERMRANRLPVTDAGTFREGVKDALRTSMDGSRRMGYSDESIAYAQYAVVAFLDESILNLQWPVFRDWPRQTLQQDIYRVHNAGEIFFQHLERLLGQVDSQELADVLEVHQLCLLLGFAGGYRGRPGELRSMAERTAQKIRRIRQTGAELSRHWKLPVENIVTATKDVWLKRVAIACGACAGLALLLLVIYKLTLNSGISRLSDLVS